MLLAAKALANPHEIERVFGARRTMQSHVAQSETSRPPENQKNRPPAPSSRRTRVGTAQHAAALPKRCRQPTTITRSDAESVRARRDQEAVLWGQPEK